MNIYKIKCIFFVILLFITCVTYPIIVYISLISGPLYTPAEYWIPEVYTLKDLRAAKITSPKIIILSGSNSLFGVCSDVLEKKLNYKVLNLAVHANLPLFFLEEKIKKYARNGDIVVFPFEYSLYSRNEPDMWMVEQFTTWGVEDMLRQNISTQVQYFIRALPAYFIRIMHIFSSLPIRTRNYIKNIFHEKKNLLTNDKIYSVDGVNIYGEFLCDKETTPKIKEEFNKGISYIADSNLSMHFLQFADFIKTYSTKNDITILFASPVSIKNSSFDLENEVYKKQIHNLTSAICEQSLKFIGDISVYNFNVNLFYDTPYHLNAEGSIYRSLMLADDIAESLGVINDFDRDERYLKSKREEASYVLQNLRNESLKNSLVPN
ncbi:hypothetical protein CE91St38_06550 [Desulfovibrionaceae bacterium]|nr:hypothetical protein CE91St38_06550 [Desulfovibrionaceae bacterium]GKI11198.1 hypothetical protein CE91St39_06520 [Desulfovibrionaceae bacterium]